MALTIPITFNIENLAELTAQVAKMTGAAGGAGAGAAGRGPGAIGSLFGGSEGAGGATAKGLGQIAKQLPGAGMMGDMVGAFKTGGIIGVGMAGVAGILGFVKQIVESSKVFQGVAGSFFKIFGAMADLFLLPFLPLAMRGMQMLMQWMPRVQEWGQRTADWIMEFIKTWSGDGFGKAVRQHIGPVVMDAIAALSNQLKEGIPGIGEQGPDAKHEWSESLGMNVQTQASITEQQEWQKAKDSPGGDDAGYWGAGGSIWDTNKRANRWSMGVGKAAGKELWNMVNFSGVRGDQFSPTIKRGDQVAGLGGIEEGVGGIMNSMEVSLARQAEKVKDYATQFQQKETGAGGMLGVWDDEVLRGSIPDTWDSIDGMYRKMNDELADEARNAESLKGGLKIPDIDLGKDIDKIQAEVEKALLELSTITLSEFVLDPSVANDIENCFTMANQCLNTKFTSLADLVEGGIEYIQAGVGGNIFDLPAIKDLVTQAQGMGGAIAVEATRIADQVALMTQQMATEGMELTVSPEAIAAEIRQLNATVDARILSTANSIAAATANVNGLVDQWAHMANDWMDPALGYGEQFGVLGSAFGEASGRANAMYGKIRGFRFKRKEQIKRGGGGGAAQTETDDGADDGADGGVGDTTGQPPGTGQPFEYERTYPDVTVVHVPDVARPAQVDAPLVFEKAEFEEAWGVGETEVREIASTAMVGEEGIDIFNDYAASVQAVVNDKSITPQYDDYSDEWWQFGGHGAGGGGGRRGVQNTSHSVMNISINTRASVQDILSDLRRIQHMDDASFFNSVS